ncbi:hypothetical protein ACSFVZ_03875 [Pseudoalteromonas sp. SYSU M81236]|jgi:hypothetical protein|uniref:hypothetical protein n=1 Tax=Pseudoalteromonas sp. SYSU M81236 TaxID=3447014 RepID=UPI003F063B75
MWLFIALLLIACDKKHTIPEQLQNKQPDLIIDNAEFYLNSCQSLSGVFNDAGKITSRVIVTFPTRLMSYCSEERTQLSYDGTYLTVKLCRTAFAAGGCGLERYRSKDFQHWQEYIGITWVNNEQYEAWRLLGSSSTKADEINKVIP